MAACSTFFVRSLVPEKAARYEAQACGKSACHVLWCKCAGEGKYDIARSKSTVSAELALGPAMHHFLALLPVMVAEESPQGTEPKYVH